MKMWFFTVTTIAATLMLAVAANGDIITSHGTISGINDADQAGPLFGQSITVNLGADTADALIPGIVFLKQVQFQSSSSGSGQGSGSVFLHVYDDFAVDGTAVPTTIGNLIAVSTNSVDLSSIGLNNTMTWTFSGSQGISKSTTYAYILASNTVAATTLDASNLRTGAFELKVGDPYSGGQAFRSSGTTSTWDLEFRVTTATGPSAVVPEPASAVFLGFGLGLFGCVVRRRRCVTAGYERDFQGAFDVSVPC